jgi:hypothetical protein
VVTCGKGVHAGQGGRGGDLYAIEIPGTSSGVDEPLPISASFGLRANYPNPSYPRTTVSYSLSRPGFVRLTIHDVGGRLVRTLAEGFRSDGEHKAVWAGEDESGRSTASGVYFARLESGNQLSTRRIVVVR